MKNELKDLLTDKEFKSVYKFLNHKSVRNYSITREFKERKSNGEKSHIILDDLASKNPKLNRETIKKIITKNKIQ